MARDYKPPIADTGISKIFTHNREQMAPGHAYALKYSPDENKDTVSILQNVDTRTLVTLFSDLVNHDLTQSSDQKGNLIIFHAVNKTDDFNLTNSKLAALHFHIVNGPLDQSHQFIVDKKTYVPNPYPNLASTISRELKGKDKSNFCVLDLSGQDEGEAKQHKILVHPGYANLSDFTQNAGDLEIEAFRNNLVTLIEPFVEEGGGGARLIIDERFYPSPVLAIHLIGGELLGQEPDKTHRWFQAPQPPSS